MMFQSLKREDGHLALSGREVVLVVLKFQSLKREDGHLAYEKIYSHSNFVFCFNPSSGKTAI